MALVVALLQVTQLSHAQTLGTPDPVAGPGPVDRQLPASARPNTAPAKPAPVVPPGIHAAGPPRKLSTAERAKLPRATVERPNMPLTHARAQDAPGDVVFEDLVLRPGFELGDTSLVVYFNLHGEDRSFSSWVVRLFDGVDGTEQASATLHVPDLEACNTVRVYCKSLGGAMGWVLDPAKEYFVTITAVFDDGRQVVSAPSTKAKPRTTIVPPPISRSQAAGCGCGNALGMTAAGQAIRATGVNTATGAFSRVERDASMASFGIPFSSVRAYSSALVGPGAFGPGWAWSYGMRVLGSDDGALVRAEDGAEAFYKLDGGAYVRPAGVRSNLARTADGWQLVTPEQITHRFDAQGRLVAILTPRQVGIRLAYGVSTVTVTDASGRVVTVTLDAGLIRTIALPDGRRVSYGYDQGRLVAVTDLRGNTWRYRYSAVGLLTDVVSPIRVGAPPHNIVDVHNEYGPDTRVVKQTDALGHATTFTWKPDVPDSVPHDESITVDPDGVATRDGYKGNVLVFTQRGNLDAVSHRYDGALNRNLVVNGKHNQHEAAFDNAGNVIEQKAPLPFSFKAVTKYDAHNNPIEHTDANGNVWKDRYNGFDEVVESTDAEGHSIHYEYDARGLLTVQIDQRGKVTRYEYLPEGDKNFGLLKASISPEARRVEFGYDATGRQIAVVDPRGTLPGANRDAFTTRYELDPGNLVVSILQPGKTDPWRTAYDQAGRITSRLTPAREKTSYAYFDNGLLNSVTDPRKTVSYTYTAAGRRAAVRVPTGSGPDIVTTYGYNAKGLVDRVTSPRGNVPGANPADFTTTYFYDGNDNLVRIRRPYPGGKFLDRDVHVDELDRTDATTDEQNKTTSFGRDNNGNVTSGTDTLGRTTTMDYDKNGRQKSITDNGKQTTGFQYDEAGNKIRQTMPEGGVTTWAYDGDGLLISATDPRGNVPGANADRFTTRHRYDAAGNPSQTIDPLGHVTVYNYDADNRLASVSDARGGTVRYTYTVDDQIRSVHAADAPFDAKKPEDNATVYDYDPDGQMRSVRDPLGHTTRFEYDRAGRLTAHIDALGRRTEIGYDTEGDMVSMITLAKNEKPGAKERAKRTIVDSYDIVGRRERHTLGSAGPVYTFGYDAKDRTTFYGDPAGKREAVYDDEDQIKTVTRTENTGKVETFGYEYDDRGNIKARSYPDGTHIEATYDKDSRLTTLTAGGGGFGAVPATWRFDYDVAGQRIATTLPASTGLVETRTYDDAGRLIGIIADHAPVGAAKPPATNGTSAAPAPRGQVAANNNTKVPGAPTGVTALAGAAQAQVSWKPPSDNGSAPLTGYTVTATPGGKTVEVGPGTTSAVVDALEPGRSYTFTVHASNKVGAGPESKPSDAVTPFPVATNPVSAFQLDLDPLGNPNRVITTRGGVSESVAYSYDKANRVTSACYAATTCSGKSAGRIDYSYDMVGNRTKQTLSGTAGNSTTTYQYDAADQLTRQTTKASGQAAVVDYGYDVQGNQTRAGADTFSYNLDHSLAKATVSGRTTSFGYDGTGLRLSATTGSGAQATTQRWSWDVNGTLPQIAVDTVTNTGGQVLDKRAFAFGPDDEPLALLAPTSGAHSYTHDWLGGVADMLSPAGAPEQGYDYDPYGNPRLGDTLKTPPNGAAAQGTTGPANPLRYTGEYQDNTTGNGNYYLRARNYNPSTGRFTTTDPAPSAGAAVSPYAYANGNPLAFTDPTGTEPHEGASGGYPPPPPTGDQGGGPSAEDIAKAHQLENKSMLDVILEAGGQILMEILGINDIINCLKGDIGACVMTVVGSLPWGKIFKAKKIAEALWKAGKAIFKFIEEIKWAKAILRGAEKAAEAAKAAAAAAAKAAAEKAAAAKALAERLAKKAAEEAEARAKALAARAKAAVKKGAKDAEDAADSCVKKHSFVAGTAVLLADGTTKPIDQTQPGDTVLATDPITGQSQARQVIRTIRTDNDKRFVDLTVRDVGAGGRHQLTATEHHPFWSVTQHRWVDAGTLRPGELLRTSAGTYVQVSAVRRYQSQEVTYDLTVDSIHTYYVVAGTTAVLVHNVDLVCGKVSYGTTDQSKMAANFRRQSGIGSDQNVAIYSVQLPNGQVAHLPFANQVRGAHSERVADDFLSELGFQPEDVKAIYSERNFCTAAKHECAGRVAKYTGALLSWSFDKGENAWAGILNVVHG